MQIKLLDSKCMPFKQHDTDAGWDLKCRESFTISPNQVRPVPLGISIEIPVGHVGLLFPRSGLSSKKGMMLANTVGVIDSDYRGEVIAMVRNMAPRIFRLGQYERLCQLVIVPIALEKLEIVSKLSDTERGEGGFGSTNENIKQESTSNTSAEAVGETKEKNEVSSEKVESTGTTKPASTEPNTNAGKKD
jgi:dUTP pyrophosphatase